MIEDKIKIYHLVTPGDYEDIVEEWDEIDDVIARRDQLEIDSYTFLTRREYFTRAFGRNFDTKPKIKPIIPWSLQRIILYAASKSKKNPKRAEFTYGILKLPEENITIHAIAIAHSQDNFSKKIGREIVIKRIMNIYKKIDKELIPELSPQTRRVIWVEIEMDGGIINP